MYIDDLIFSKREFLKELMALCKKWNVKIDGCGCCGSPRVEFEDETMENLYASGEKFYIDTENGETAIFSEHKHDIHVEKITYPSEDGDYIYTAYVATCRKCGKYERSNGEIGAREALEFQECK